MKGRRLFRRAAPVLVLLLAVLMVAAYDVRPAQAAANLYQPSGVAVDPQGNIYVADTGHGRIVKLSSSGRTLAVFTMNHIDLAFSQPTGVAVDRAGDVYVTDAANDRVLKYSVSGRFLAQWGTPGDGEFSSPHGIAVGDRGNVFVANTGNREIEKLSPSGYVLETWETQAQDDGDLYNPLSIAVDHQGNVYSSGLRWSPDCNCNSYTIQKRSSAGDLVDEWSVGDQIGGIAIGGRGNLFASDVDGGTILKFSPDGEQLAEWGGNPDGSSVFDAPAGIVIGGRGNIFVADNSDNCIVKLSATGRLMTAWA